MNVKQFSAQNLGEIVLLLLLIKNHPAAYWGGRRRIFIKQTNVMMTCVHVGYMNMECKTEGKLENRCETEQGRTEVGWAY